MVDSSVVLFGQTLTYTLYALAIIALMGWFAHKVAKTKEGRDVTPAVFYSFVGFLIVAGVSLHIITHETIPWKPMDLNRESIKPDKIFSINISGHKFILPEKKMIIKKGEIAQFNVTSVDLTYGFGLFREDNSMVFQMQVLPWYVNDVMWYFDKSGVYTIRSTEYSGPKGSKMIEKNAIEVIE